jgi:hypothetical protein
VARVGSMSRPEKSRGDPDIHQSLLDGGPQVAAFVETLPDALEDRHLEPFLDKSGLRVNAGRNLTPFRRASSKALRGQLSTVGDTPRRL